MKVTASNIIYKNPLPQLRSRHSFFPSGAALKGNSIIASFAMGEAFESVDSTSYVAFSDDMGITWGKPQAMFDFGKDANSTTDYCKVTSIDGEKLVAIGYTYFRPDPELPIGNPETGGVLDDFIFFSTSEDGGKTWAQPKRIDSSFGLHVEASAPITVLKDGTWITPIANFPDWDGKFHAKNHGRLLRSEDSGKTWTDDAVCMDFEGRNVTCYEQRVCQLESGTIIDIAWNEDVDTGDRLHNHFTYSTDNGKTWSRPASTDVMGQASSVCHIDGEKFLAIHAVRRDTDRPGIYAYVIDFSDKTWNVIDSALVWEPKTKVEKMENMAEIFAFLKFGQPGAVKLNDGSLMMTHWCAENGEYMTVATKIKL